MQQGGLYAWIEPILQNTSMHVILLTFEFIKIPTKKHSTPMESIIGGRLYSKLSDSVGVLGYK